MFALLMAGGQGTRLWPVSRKSKPKQLLKLIEDKTLLEATYHRLLNGFSPQEIFIATTSDYKKHIRKQLPEIPKDNYSIEPELKDRGPALGLAALLMHAKDRQSIFVTSWSDHYIKNQNAYFKTLKTAEQVVNKHPGSFVTVGVKPTHPHTGLGYIKLGKKLGPKAYRVSSFKEKPDLKTAERFLKSKQYLWNTGYFICRTERLLELYAQHLPEIYSLLMKIKPYIGSIKQQWAINTFYPRMPKVDIEKGLIEKLSDVAAVEAVFDWADIGSWQIIKDVLSEKKDNLIKGLALHHKAEGSLIYNFEKKLVAVTGLKDIIVVNTKDALLIAPKNQSEAVKELIEKIKADPDLKKYL
ncbi:MAG: sugar phosphate nucleotidyltransferase [Patescibacteria group bacterium]|nr:sugar phosphate nucleotidyltransferase [Patescibacteria group bacterium]